MQKAGILLFAWWICCSLLLASAVAAQTETDDTSAAEDQYSQGEEGCANPQPIETFSGSENQRTAPFNITGESFRILFETEPAGQDPFLPTVEVDVLNENGRPIGEGFLAFEGEDGAENILVGPGTFSLEIRADDASYELTVEDCAGADESNGDEGNGDGDVDDPDDIVPGTGKDGPLPNTGGVPLLLGAVSLACASALLARRTLAP